MTTNTPTRPQPTAPDAADRPPAHTGFALFSARIRGRHRKPRPRKLLLAAGGLALAVGTLGLVRTASDPGPGDIGAEAGLRPVPDTASATSPGNDSTDSTAGTTPASPASPAPEASPSSPAALGGQSGVPLTSTAPDGTAAPTATAPAAPTAPNTPNAPGAPAPTGTAPDEPPPGPPGRTPSQSQPPPDRQAPPPPPSSDRPGETDDGPLLCVPIIGLCVDGGLTLTG
ncbi:hypothetical protein WJ438_15820 [Streptomyces sp. GD-15H]|uniref:hypothetical protein n=1 Tax=Streptomyces sp. GD-15H TaxID=3129112 RepID=UPI00324DBFDE